jgi:hypothetical protein
MKKISFLFLVFALGLGINISNAQVAEFKETTIDYGSIEQNSDPLRTFVVKNTGKAPLVISGAKGSCGCTVPSYDEEPIMPGKTSEIQVKYDTKRVGTFNKTVTLTTNALNGTSEDTPGVFVLKIKGKVNGEEVPEVPTSIPTTPSNPN